MAHARVAVVASFVFISACGSAPQPPAPAAPTSTDPPQSKTFDGTPWATFHSKRFELSLRLPDGPAWRIDDHRSAWLRATHEGTRSKIILRSWREDENVTRGACYARARGWDPSLPDLEASRLLDDGVRPLDSQRARVIVGLTGTAADAPSIGGFVLAIVGEVRRCLLVAYATEADGPAAEGAVADRLAVVAERLLPTIKLDQSFAPSREPAMPSRPGPGGAGGSR
ncbi:MAG TPA: hypothetical protein VK540_05920 [Polyangiaceae bacterium]|nr:hypothetical protein [Polyangiaceae bacterium]